MSANIIDGKEVARKLREKISRSVKEINSEHNIVPGLAVVLVGNDPASEVYVRNKGIQTNQEIKCTLQPKIFVSIDVNLTDWCRFIL